MAAQKVNEKRYSRGFVRGFEAPPDTAPPVDLDSDGRVGFEHANGRAVSIPREVWEQFGSKAQLQQAPAGIGGARTPHDPASGVAPAAAPGAQLVLW